MSPTDSVTHWLRGLQAGAPDAVRPLYERYFQRLVNLARSKLQGMPLRAVGPEDVAAHAFASFCLRLERGGIAPLTDRDDLWRLLAGIVVHKALKAKRHHFAKKRGEGKVRGESAWAHLEGEPDGAVAGIDGEEGKDVSADFLAEANEEFQRRLDALGNETLRSIALWKLEGDSNEEIADKLGVVPRSIERKLKRIRSIWRPEEDGDEPQAEA